MSVVGPSESRDVQLNLYGVAAEFTGPETLLAALRAAREHGYTRLETFTPFHVEGLLEILEEGRKSRVPMLACLTFCAGLSGAAIGYGMQYYAAAIDYPQLVAGRPYQSWPAFVPVTFELAVLFAGITAALGMLIINGLPRLNHPVFNHPEFGKRGTSQFLLLIKANDPLFMPGACKHFLESTGGLAITEVTRE